MFDVEILKKDRTAVERMLKMRGEEAPLDTILSLDEQRAGLVRQINELREERNRISDQVKSCKDPGEREKLIKTNREIREKVSLLEKRLAETEEELRRILIWVPNMLAPDVPYGEDDSGNVEIRRWGNPREFDFQPKDHVELGEALGIIDIARGAKVWGTRTYFLKGDAVFLEFALVRFALDLLVAEGFKPVIPPVIVREDILEGTRHYPFFKEQIYRIEGENLGLVGTSEIPLCAMHAQEIIDEADLPIKYVGFSPCYRTEVGSGGRDVRGLIRTHHFDKVEMFVFDKPSESEKTHEWMLSLEERIYQSLGIPYRVVKICSGDLGPVAYKKYDIEFWKPSEGTYREITSCSNCTDFQARGLNIRYRPAGGGKPEFVHTLNGTAIAIGRTLVAIIENYQNSDGTVTVPEVLRKYMPGNQALIR
ncbi:MAG TPA: serine--tRNA ligase [Firmicutes bacterium]|uniref:Serine--tRNA ligase n=1 Tax=Candidatus Fermentithermobacillus carboniphilus TaxID=3085328 RepID=A0AAT9LDM6_9FIRM|nr:MAG: serine--tRNA ligase [Candidatus Fermentithermobacillus carboniphilus]HHW17566.1 serine--tRNA ligase [Candidatus Fermentithermobacillaceae bacterium]